MSIIRRQASLYLEGNSEVEEMRRRFNPIQAALIPAHVTLCREDEVEDWSELKARLIGLGAWELTLEFDKAIRDGDLVYLPAISGIESFDQLRIELLGNEGRRPRKHAPHITIIHPRNGRCTDAIFAEIGRCLQPFHAMFREVSMIEQVSGGPWVRFLTSRAIDA